MQSMPVPESDEEKIRLQAQLLNAVEQAILAVDLTGRIIFWNRSAETLYGWTEDEAHGRNIAEVLAAPLLMEAARANLGQLRRGESWSGEFLVQRRDGTTFTAQVSASLIQNERRTLISIIGVSRDSTDQQQLQEANRLLAEVGALLTDVVDYEAPLTTLAQLAVPHSPTGVPFTCCKPMARSRRWRWRRPRRPHCKRPTTGCNTICPRTTRMGCRPCYAAANRN